MRFDYTRQGLAGRERSLERALEMVPGIFSWVVLIMVGVLSVIRPLVAAGIIIAFDLYWVLRLFYMNIFLLLSYFILSAEEHTDWMRRIEELDQGCISQQVRLRDLSVVGLRRWISALKYQRQRRRLQTSPVELPFSGDIVHAVIIPAIRESREVIEPGIRALAGGSYPSRRMAVFIGLEECALPDTKNAVYALQSEYRGYFIDLIIVEHPQGLPGEARVKGANVTWAARRAAGFFEQRGISFDNVIVSCFDADTVVHADYFACLTYTFMITPERTRASYQPIPVYHNNIWEAPAFARIVDIGASFFQLIESTNPETLVTFSSHSMSFKALVEAGYWPVDMVSDDSAIFWKTFIAADGNHHVIPLYVTLSMDVAVASTTWYTVQNVYRQKRRWAWGVENFPIVMRAFIANGRIPLWRRLSLGIKLFEGQIAWAVWPFLLTVVGWLPIIAAGAAYEQTTMYYTSARVTATVFQLSGIALVSCIFLSLSLLPRPRPPYRFLRRLAHVFEWFLIPLVGIMFSGIPALDAQTRLMLGRYMEFRVTEKHRSDTQ
jgi:hypothetical protein